MSPIKNAIFIADIHAGCQLGLFPTGMKIVYDEGGNYYPSKAQKVVWGWWNHFFDVWVPIVTREEPYILVINGDTLEGRHHGTTSQITQNFSDQERIAYEILAPQVDKAKQTYAIRGTSAHVGEAGEREEQLFAKLGVKLDENGRASRHELWLRIGDAIVHVMHHIGTTGSMAYETTALMKEYAEACAEAARWGQGPPDFVVRAHRHRRASIQVPTSRGNGECFTLPGWQLKTPFTYKIPGGRLSLPQFGGSLIRQGDEEFYSRHRTWSVQRPKMEIPS